MRLCPAKAAETMVTRKWLSPSGRAPVWPAWRCDSSSISSLAGARPSVSLVRMLSATRPILRPIREMRPPSNALRLMSPARKPALRHRRGGCTYQPPLPPPCSENPANPDRDLGGSQPAAAFARLRPSGLPRRRRLSRAAFTREPRSLFLVLPRPCPRIQCRVELLCRHERSRDRGRNPQRYDLAAADLALRQPLQRRASAAHSRRLRPLRRARRLRRAPGRRAEEAPAHGAGGGAAHLRDRAALHPRPPQGALQGARQGTPSRRAWRRQGRRGEAQSDQPSLRDPQSELLLLT